MGVSFSYPFDDFGDLGNFDEDFEELIMRSLACKDEVKTTCRSASYNGRDSERIFLKKFGSGKLFIDGALGIKRRELNPSHLEKRIPLPPSSSQEIGLRPISSTGGEASALKSISVKRAAINEPSRTFPSNSSLNKAPSAPQSESSGRRHQAALKLQKVYKSFQTRRRLADCAVLAEQHWWNLLDFAVLKRSSVSFFDLEKQETAISRWSRARTRAAMVGRGLSKDRKARKLALQHWLEAIDPRHRYGHNLHMYYVGWLRCESKQPFFYWLDVGDGRDLCLQECTRTRLQRQCIKYLGPTEREAYEVTVNNGDFRYHRSGELLDTSEPAQGKWIFVLSTLKKLYVGKKEKGTFQHSSFLAGGATSAAGRLVVESGILKAVWPHSGHYRPTKENFQQFVDFLKERNVDFTNVKKLHHAAKNNPHHESPTEDEDECLNANTEQDSSQVNIGRPTTGPSTNNRSTQNEPKAKQSRPARPRPSRIAIPPCAFTLEKPTTEAEDQLKGGLPLESQPERGNGLARPQTMFQKRNLFDEQEVEEEDTVPPEKIIQRLASRKGTKSYQLGEQLSFKWASGLGPRIVCVRDYPSELQFRALEEMLLSPRSSGSRPYTPRAGFSPMKLGSPRPFNTSHSPNPLPSPGPFHSRLNPNPFHTYHTPKPSPSPTCLSPKPLPTSCLSPKPLSTSLSPKPLPTSCLSPKPSPASTPKPLPTCLSPKPSLTSTPKLLPTCLSAKPSPTSPTSKPLATSPSSPSKVSSSEATKETSRIEQQQQQQPVTD
ncbi:hypothetical protein ACLOJK_031633 [Asimina triloba]